MSAAGSKSPPQGSSRRGVEWIRDALECSRAVGAEIFDTLQEIGYDNTMVVEACGLSLEKLVPTCKIWRRMYATERELAADAPGFMKQQVALRRETTQ